MKVGFVEFLPWRGEYPEKEYYPQGFKRV